MESGLGPQGLFLGLLIKEGTCQQRKTQVGFLSRNGERHLCVCSRWWSPDGGWW